MTMITAWLLIMYKEKNENDCVIEACVAHETFMIVRCILLCFPCAICISIYSNKTPYGTSFNHSSYRRCRCAAGRRCLQSHIQIGFGSPQLPPNFIRNYNNSYLRENWIAFVISFSYKLTSALTVDNTELTLLLFNCEQSQLLSFYFACYVVRTFFQHSFCTKSSLRVCNHILHIDGRIG